jgi:hypothetical protein
MIRCGFFQHVSACLGKLPPGFRRCPSTNHRGTGQLPIEFHA